VRGLPLVPALAEAFLLIACAAWALVTIARQLRGRPSPEALPALEPGA
jgi:hypothetical protein